MNVGKNSASSDSHVAEQLVQLLVVLHGKSDVARHDAALLVVTGGVASELENLGTEVLENGGEVHRGASSHAGGVLALTKVTSDTTDGELQTGLGRRGRALLLSTASFSFSCRIQGTSSFM